MTDDVGYRPKSEHHRSRKARRVARAVWLLALATTCLGFVVGMTVNAVAGFGMLVGSLVLWLAPFASWRVRHTQG